MFKELIEKESLKSITPLILSEDEASSFPSEASTLISQGILESFIPNSLGGGMGSVQEVLETGRLLSRRNLTSAIALGQTLLGALPVWLSGNSEQKKAVSEVLKNKGLGCLALTEVTNGSDLSLTQTQELSGAISGEKWCINNASLGSMMSVLTTRDELLSLHLILKKHPYTGNFSYSEKLKTLGIRGADISGIIFKSFQQENSLIGKPGAGLEIVLKTMQISRLLCASFSLGAADTTLRSALDFSIKRKLYGKEILKLPAVAQKLEASYQKLLMMEAFTLVTSRMVTMAPECMSLYSAVSKFYVTQLADDIIRSSSEVIGARFYLRDSEYGLTQKMMRDHRVVSLFDGNSDVNKAIIAGQIKRMTYVGELKNNIVDIFSLKTQAPDFTGDEALKLTTRGRDIIWEALTHYPFNSHEVSELLIQRRELFTRINAVENQSQEMLKLVEEYCALTLKANYFIFCYFNQEAFGEGISERNLATALGQVQKQQLLSHFTYQLHD